MGAGRQDWGSPKEELGGTGGLRNLGRGAPLSRPLQQGLHFHLCRSPQQESSPGLCNLTVRAATGPSTQGRSMPPSLEWASGLSASPNLACVASAVPTLPGPQFPSQGRALGSWPWQAWKSHSVLQSPSAVRNWDSREPGVGPETAAVTQWGEGCRAWRRPRRHMERCHTITPRDTPAGRG